MSRVAERWVTGTGGEGARGRGGERRTRRAARREGVAGRVRGGGRHARLDAPPRGRRAWYPRAAVAWRRAGPRSQSGGLHDKSCWGRFGLSRLTHARRKKASAPKGSGTVQHERRVGEDLELPCYSFDAAPPGRATRWEHRGHLLWSLSANRMLPVVARCPSSLRGGCAGLDLVPSRRRRGALPRRLWCRADGMSGQPVRGPGVGYRLSFEGRSAIPRRAVPLTPLCLIVFA